MQYEMTLDIGVPHEISHLWPDLFHFNSPCLYLKLSIFCLNVVLFRYLTEYQWRQRVRRGGHDIIDDFFKLLSFKQREEDSCCDVTLVRTFFINILCVYVWVSVWRYVCVVYGGLCVYMCLLIHVMFEWMCVWKCVTLSVNRL